MLLPEKKKGRPTAATEMNDEKKTGEDHI